jgi:hypothetical protein
VFHSVLVLRRKNSLFCGIVQGLFCVFSDNFPNGSFVFTHDAELTANNPISRNQMCFCFHAVCFDEVEDMASITVKNCKGISATVNSHLVTCLVIKHLMMQVKSEVFCGIVVKECLALCCLGFGVDFFCDCCGGELWCGGRCHGVCVVVGHAKSITHNA